MSSNRRSDPGGDRDHTSGPDTAGSGHRPPRWLERVLERALPSGLSGEGTLGDLAEAYDRRARASRLHARAWYAAQAASIVAYRVFTGSGTDRAGTDSDLVMDFRWSLRTIFKRPGFTVGVVAVLGLGLGAVGAVYSVVDGTLKNTSWWADADPESRRRFALDCLAPLAVDDHLLDELVQ